MAIRPGSTQISLIISGGTATLYADEITYTRDILDFDRLEFSNAKLRDAPTTTGAKPIILEAFGGQPIQLATTCTNDVIRPLGPDDNNISSIKQRFNIQRFTIKGAPSTTANTDLVYTQALTDQNLLNTFGLYQDELNMELSITYLESLQSQTFSYLTTTSTSLTGPAINGTISNLLITEYTPDVAYEYQVAGGSTSVVARAFTLTLEQRTLTSRGSV